MKKINTALVLLGGLTCAITSAQEAHSPLLLVLHKGENAMAVVNPANGNVLGRVPTGQDPHELVISDDGSLAFASNYAGPGPRGGNTLSVIDIAAKKEVHRVDLSPLSRPHGLWFSDGKLYFTVEGSMAIARYDPKSNKVDWVLGLGQDRTHMIVVSKDQKTIFTSNVSSNTISIIERRDFGGPAGPRRVAQEDLPAEGRMVRLPVNLQAEGRMDRLPMDRLRVVVPVDLAEGRVVRVGHRRVAVAEGRDGSKRSSRSEEALRGLTSRLTARNYGLRTRVTAGSR